MNRYTRSLFIIVLAAFLAAHGVSQATAAAEIRPLVNVWALGVNNDDCDGGGGGTLEGWGVNQFGSLSVCPKNARPEGKRAGAAFKNGPVNGNGVPGETAVFWQDFTLPTAVYSVDFSVWIIYRGPVTAAFDLYGSNDGGQSWELIANVLTFTPETAPCSQETNERFRLYCGNATGVPAYDLYRFQFESVFLFGLGFKATGFDLAFTEEGA